MDPSRGGNDNDVEKSKESEKRDAATVSLPKFMGKHRMAAAIALLDQEIQFMQEEVGQLETIGGASIVCKEFVSTVESIPDALLPVTRAPTQVAWERWFQRSHGSKNRKKWI